MKKTLEILKEIMGNKLLYFQLAKQDFSLMKINEAIAELEEAMKPKMCDGCDNNHKDRTIFYDGKKALMCTFCKYGAVSYFKPKDNK